MEKKNTNMWKISFIISVIIIFIMLVYIIVTSIHGNNTSVAVNVNESNSSANLNNEKYTHIRIDEDLSTEGNIEGIENVRWNNARIRHDDNQMEISIMLNNKSKTEKIEARTLEVVLYDENGKEIASKEVKMEEINENYGYTNIELALEIEKPIIIYDIKIIAK